MPPGTTARLITDGRRPGPLDGLIVDPDAGLSPVETKRITARLDRDVTALCWWLEKLARGPEAPNSQEA